MKLLRRSLIALAGLPLTCRASRARSISPAWSEWETSAVEKRGPERAAGLLLYFHGSGAPDMFRGPIPLIFIEMAKAATWDILRINRLSDEDVEAADDDLLSFVAIRIAQARQQGYKRIIVAGYSRGGWLALLAATLPVDAAIGLAPGTGPHTIPELERTRDLLAQTLAGARAKRVAAFFFEGDPVEDLSERRATAVRRGLQNSQSTFMVVDRPPDLHGHLAGVTGRFARRYRDCLLQLVQDADQPAGEVQCSCTSGYAIGSDIGFPASNPVLKLPADVNPAFFPYLGRWEGDDETGTYVIMESVRAGPTHISFRAGLSPPPGLSDDADAGWRVYRFELDEARHGIVYKLQSGLDGTRARLKSATELECEAVLGNCAGKGGARILLHKRTAAPADH
jgi:dienelactone hydrolase